MIKERFITLFSIVSLTISTQALTAVTNTVTYKDKILKSVNSKICHNDSSPYFNRIKVLDDKSNKYDSLDECLLDSGKLTPAMKKQLAAEDTDVLIEQIENEKKGEEKEKAETKFYGINWGLGLAFTGLDADAISDVTIESGEVRVNSQFSNRAIAMLESHYFFTPSDRDYGHGPYMAIGIVGEENINPLKTYGLGYMWGFKVGDTGSSWNIGLGVFVDTEVSQLRSGIKDGDQTTETDPNKLLTKTDEVGWMVMFSATF